MNKLSVKRNFSRNFIKRIKRSFYNMKYSLRRGILHIIIKKRNVQRKIKEIIFLFLIGEKLKISYDGVFLKEINIKIGWHINVKIELKEGISFSSIMLILERIKKISSTEMELYPLKINMTEVTLVLFLEKLFLKNNIKAVNLELPHFLEKMFQKRNIIIYNVEQLKDIICKIENYS